MQQSNKMQAREITQFGKYLPCKQEDLNPIPRTHLKKQSVVWTCKPSTGEAETGGSLGFTDQSGSLPGKLQISERPSLKTKVHLRSDILTSVRTHMHTYPTNI